MAKKIRVMAFIALLIGILCLTLCACSFSDDLTNYEVDKDKEQTTVTVEKLTLLTQHDGSYVYGEQIDLTEVTFLAEYNNGVKETVKLLDSMLSGDDKNLFFALGAHTVVINYGGKTLNLQIEVKQLTDIKKFTAKFFSNEGNTIPDQTVDIITVFRNPEKKDYTFAGWYTDINLTGNRAIAPYTLTANVKFYAKWIDNRSYTVTFIDLDGTVLNAVGVNHGDSIDINDTESYPAPSVKEGKIFAGWTVVSGQTDNITGNTVIKAVYNDVQCLVKISHVVPDDTAGEGATKITDTTKYVVYGDYFDIDGFVMPTKTGHKSRWVVYINDSDSFLEWTDASLATNGTKIQVKVDKLVINVYHQINVYELSVYNGKEKQTEANLKSGDIQLETVLSYGESTFKKEYNSGFVLSQNNGGNPAVTIQNIYGYNVEWCIVTLDENKNEIWRNFRNKVWNETTQSFRVQAGETESVYFTVKDTAGNALCVVNNGDIYNIQGEFAIKPKYTKASWQVHLYRNDSFEIETFTVKYYDTFSLYDPKLYDASYSSWQEVKEDYLLNNVFDWLPSNGNAEGWMLSEWDILWYTNANKAEENKVVFEEYGGIEIKGETHLYSKDVDNRKYEVKFIYGYNFATDSYDKSYAYSGDTALAQNDIVTLPPELTAGITKSNAAFTYNVNYTFSGWYDHPYDGGKGGYGGVLQSNLNSRTRNVTYYAHYQSAVTYTLTINDKTQKDAYAGVNGYDGNGYDVADGTMFYTLSDGSTIDTTMLFKGLTQGNTIITGQSLYEQFAYLQNFSAVSLKFRQYVAEAQGMDSGAFLTDNEALVFADAAYTALLDLANKLEKQLSNYYGILNKVYNYDYEGIMELAKADPYALSGDKEDVRKYYDYYMNGDGNHLNMPATAVQKQQQLYEYKQKAELIKNYNNNYKAKFDEYSSLNAQGKYKSYMDSPAHLNGAKSGSQYEFAGWYLDANYEIPLNNNIAGDATKDVIGNWTARQNNDTIDEFTILMSKNITLYAKWIDALKGSEGLVFERVQSVDYNYYVVVVGYVNNAQYAQSEYYGCGYNFNNGEYSINMNDQDRVPSDLGSNISLQIPAQHGANAGGIPYEVVGIKKGAFDLNGSKITSVTLPGSLKFVAEGVFANCYLNNITYSEMGEDKDSLFVKDEKVLYQKKDCDLFYNASQGVEEYYKGETLIAYASESDLTELTMESWTKRIGDYALLSAANLTTVNTGNQLTTIGTRAFYGCNSLTTLRESPDKAALPDSLTTVKKEAFGGCYKLDNLQVNPTGGFDKAESKAFSDTLWYLKQKGIASLNGILIGIYKPSSDDFKKVGNDYVKSEKGEFIVENGNDRLYIDGTSYNVVRVELNDAYKGIGQNAFAQATNVIEIYINASVLNYIDSGVFKNCGSLAVVNLADSNGNIQLVSGEKGYDQFDGCNASLGVMFGSDNVASYVNKDGWKEVKSKVDILGIDASGVLTDYYYYNRNGAMNVTLSEYVRGLGDDIFKNITNLTGINLPAGLTSIGSGAFFGCSALTSVNIPSSATTVGQNAFYGCNSLRSMTLPLGLLSGGTYTNFGYLFGTVSGEQNALYVPSSLTKVTLINSSVPYSLAADAFYGLDKINDFTINSAVTGIGDRAFFGCSGINTFFIPSSVVAIGTGAFENCTSLNTLKFGENSLLKTISSRAFYGCGNSKLITQTVSLDLPQSVTAIGESAFFGWSKLSKISLPFIGDNAVAPTATHLGYIFGATAYTDYDKVPASLTSVIVKKSASTITLGDNAFYKLSSLTSVELADNVSAIGNYAFYDCSSVAKINIPYSVSSIGNYAFAMSSADAGALSYVTFESGSRLTDIGDYAFRYGGRTKLNGDDVIAFSAPSTVLNIGAGALQGWSLLVQLTLPYVGEKADLSGKDTLDAVFGVTNGEERKAYSLTELTLTSTDALQPNALKEWAQITKLNLPAQFADIGRQALYLSGVSNVTLAEGNTSFVVDNGILYSANKDTIHYYFANNTATDLIVAPNVVKIGEYAFSGAKLNSVTVPLTVTQVGYGAFNRMDFLRAITLPFVGDGSDTATVNYDFGADNEIVPSAAKDYVSKNVDNLAISVLGGTTIAPRAFYNWSQVSSIRLPSTAAAIGLGVVEGCSSLTYLAMPFVGLNATNSAKGYLGYMFGAESKTNHASKINASFSTLELIQSAVKIDLFSNALDGCSMLKTVIVKANLGTINTLVFNGCTALTKLALYNETTPVLNGTYPFASVPSEFRIFVPDQAKDKYTNASGWSTYSNWIMKLSEFAA